MKLLPIFLILLSGCHHIKKEKVIEGVDYPIVPPHVIEINKVPHPFNLNNFNEYIVWVNGKKVSMQRDQKNALIALVGARNITPVSDADIHNGDGWLRPLYPDRKSFELAIFNAESN